MEAPMKDAERLARLEQAMRRCLELLDAERPEDARTELSRAIGAGTPRGALAADVTDQELEHAFERAHPVAEEVVDADRVARDAIREVDRERLEGPAEPSRAFATSTMAELLERQGDLEGARRIREALAHRDRRRETAPRLRPRTDRARVLETLEQWLGNVTGKE
jgi:hypothetical protein